MNSYSRISVGVAGATGYAGLELLRRLARHPHAEIRHAMASSASESRRLPALARIWDAPVEPLDPERLAGTDAVFLALHDVEDDALAIRFHKYSAAAAIIQHMHPFYRWFSSLQPENG